MTERHNLVPLAEADWLEAHLSDANLRIADVRYRPLRSGDRWVITDDRAAYDAGHVPGAVFAESSRGFVEARQDGSLALAPPDMFAEFASRLGVGSETLVVVYDDLPVPNVIPAFGGVPLLRTRTRPRSQRRLPQVAGGGPPG
jgi:thiosulfate/3-mercaptopyruvate sulfurtransferase